MKTTIAASGKVRDVVILVTPSLETESLIAAAREQGFDAVVAMQPAEDTQFHMTGPGLTVFRTGGGQKSFTCNSMRIVAFWHDSWEEFTEVEKRAVSDAMKVFVGHQIDQTLKRFEIACAIAAIPSEMCRSWATASVP